MVFKQINEYDLSIAVMGSSHLNALIYIYYSRYYNIHTRARPNYTVRDALCVGFYKESFILYCDPICKHKKEICLTIFLIFLQGGPINGWL